MDKPVKKYTELARKLKALVDGGMEGERENAKKLLDSLMKKHGITMEEIESEEVEFRWFEFKKELHDIFVQTAISVCGNRIKRYQQRTNINNGDFRMALELTRAEWIELDAKFAYYGNLYKEELDIFFIAFVQKNQLFNPDGSELMDINDLTEEEQEKFFRAQRMGTVIKQGEYNRQLMSKQQLRK